MFKCHFYFQVIIEQNHRTPKADTTSPRTHVKPVGDLVLYLMIAEHNDFGINRTVSRKRELMSQLLVWLWEGEVLTMLNFWADPLANMWD